MAKKEQKLTIEKYNEISGNIDKLLKSMKTYFQSCTRITNKILDLNLILNFNFQDFNECLENYLENGKKNNRSLFRIVPTFSIQDDKLIVRGKENRHSFYELSCSQNNSQNNAELKYVYYYYIKNGRQENELKTVGRLLFENNYVIYEEKEVTLDLPTNDKFSVDTLKKYVKLTDSVHEMASLMNMNKQDFLLKFLENDEFEQDGSKFKITENEETIKFSADVAIKKDFCGKAKIDCILTPTTFYSFTSSEKPDALAICHHGYLLDEYLPSNKDRKIYRENPIEYYKNSIRPDFLSYGDVIVKHALMTDEKLRQKEAEKTQKDEEKRKKLLKEAGKDEEKQDVDVKSQIEKQKELKDQEKCESEQITAKTTDKETKKSKTKEQKQTTDEQKTEE